MQLEDWNDSLRAAAGHFRVLISARLIALAVRTEGQHWIDPGDASSGEPSREHCHRRDDADRGDESKWVHDTDVKQLTPKKGGEAEDCGQCYGQSNNNSGSKQQQRFAEDEPQLSAGLGTKGEANTDL